MMKTLHDIRADLRFLCATYHVSPSMALVSSRGFHALAVYRISHTLHRLKVPIVPLILTRLIQVLYGIDIDYRSHLAGGIIILHGVGVVIGKGVTVQEGTIIFHGVTLGVRKLFVEEFPLVEAKCVLAAGCKIFGQVTIGSGSIIGANCVVLENVPAGSIVKPAKNSILTRNAV